jgi:hypothetical protein
LPLTARSGSIDQPHHFGNIFNEPDYHQFTIPLPYLFTNNLSLEGLYTYLPNTAKMGRKFFVGGNFKMYVYALFQVTPSTLTFPLPLGLAC